MSDREQTNNTLGWRRKDIIKAISAGTVEQKRERLRRIGILDADNKLTPQYAASSAENGND